MNELMKDCDISLHWLPIQSHLQRRMPHTQLRRELRTLSQTSYLLLHANRIHYPGDLSPPMEAGRSAYGVIVTVAVLFKSW